MHICDLDNLRVISLTTNPKPRTVPYTYLSPELGTTKAAAFLTEGFQRTTFSVLVLGP
ncbi:hypothetical protein Hanom_Chr14g01323271 [Helianthus anomalus]